MIDPSQRAVNVANALVESGDVQTEVLKEAAESGEESGRSICGSDNEEVHGPLSQSFASVYLPKCPVGDAGLMHGGGGHSWTAPEHSLVDMANVLLGSVDASLVVGTSTSDLMMAPDESKIENTLSVFSDAIGVQVETHEDVKKAIMSHEARNPPMARKHIRRQLPGLFRRVSTQHNIPQAVPATAAVSSTIGGIARTPVARMDSIRSNLWRIATSLFTFDLGGSKVNLADAVLSQAAGGLVLAAFLYFLGGSPSQLARRHVGG